MTQTCIDIPSSPDAPAFAWTGTHFAKIKQREINKDLFVNMMAADHGVYASRVVASRLSNLDELSPALVSLSNPDGLPDVEQASQRIAASIVNNETIGIVTDHDVDGVSSHAVILSALKSFGFTSTKSYIGHRLNDGYGLSDPVADRVIKDMPTVVITADCGSSDEDRIQRLKQTGIDVIVTDHHELPLAGPPKSAFATVSPARKDSDYGDPYIAGCMVSWLLMCKVRQALIKLGHLPSDTPTLAHLLDFVGLGTVADCVTMGGSINNRAVVKHSLWLVDLGRRPCWQVAEKRGWLSDPVSSLDFGFQIGPRINARGRLDEAMAGVHFLMADTYAKADEIADLLESENKERKGIEKRLVETAVQKANFQAEHGDVGLAIWLPEGHPGVHGIVASRIVERFGAPVVCLSPHTNDPDIITGSARSVDGVNIKDVLDTIAGMIGGKMLKHGGHAGAGGLSIIASALDEFMLAFDEAVRMQIQKAPGPVLVTDGECHFKEVMAAPTLPVKLQRLEPYGRGFEQPVFEFSATVESWKPMGDGSHLSLNLVASDGTSIRGVWFNANPDSMPLPFEAGCQATIIGSPTLNTFRGRTSVQLIVRAVAF